jgi:hypothetical protein
VGLRYGCFGAAAAGDAAGAASARNCDEELKGRRKGVAVRERAAKRSDEASDMALRRTRCALVAMLEMEAGEDECRSRETFLKLHASRDGMTLVDFEPQHHENKDWRQMKN